MLLQPAFKKFADSKFTLVLLEAKGATFESGSPAAKLADEFKVTSFPMLVLTDADGLLYAREDYVGEKIPYYERQLQNDMQFREARDKLLGPTKQGTDDEKLAAAVKFLKWLSDNKMLGYYQSQIQDWMALANRIDPNNEKGYGEDLFIADWLNRLDEVSKQETPQIKAVGDLLLQWRKSHKIIKHPNELATLHFEVAKQLALRGDQEAPSRSWKGRWPADRPIPSSAPAWRRSSAARCAVLLGNRLRHRRRRLHRHQQPRHRRAGKGLGADRRRRKARDCAPT